MNCDYIKLFINDYADDYLTDDQFHVIDTHLKQCNSCRLIMEQIKCQKKELASLDSPSLTPTFTEDILAKTELYYFQKENVHPIKNPVVYYATAASLLIASVVSFSLPDNAMQPEPGSQPLLQMSLNQQQVNMIFNTPNDLQNVTFTVILPKNVEMVGHPGKKQVVWSGSLSAGPNLLTIPVVSQFVFSGVLITKLNYENKSKIFEVNVTNINKNIISKKNIT